MIRNFWFITFFIKHLELERKQNRKQNFRPNLNLFRLIPLKEDRSWTWQFKRKQRRQFSIMYSVNPGRKIGLGPNLVKFICLLLVHILSFYKIWNIFIKHDFQVVSRFLCLLGHPVARRGRPTPTIPSPSHILLIFSFEPPRNLRPFKNIFFKCPILEDKNIFWKSGHVIYNVCYQPAIRETCQISR